MKKSLLQLGSPIAANRCWQTPALADDNGGARLSGTTALPAHVAYDRIAMFTVDYGDVMT